MIFKCLLLLTYVCQNKQTSHLVVISQIIHWFTNLIPTFLRIWIYCLTLMKALPINEVWHIHHWRGNAGCRVVPLQRCTEDPAVHEHWYIRFRCNVKPSVLQVWVVRSDRACSVLQSNGKGSLWCVDPEYRPNLIQALKKQHFPAASAFCTPPASPPR